MIEPIDECIYEIDDILCFIAKDDKWQKLANRLTKLLLLQWDEEQKDAIRDAIRFFAAGDLDSITKDEMKFVIQVLQDKLGARLAEVFRKNIQKIQLESYTRGHIDIGIQFEFNTVDQKALYWLFEKDVKQFWIGESYSTSLNETLNNIAADVLKAGLGRDEAGKYFKSILGTEFEKTNNYWELLSNHIVTRAREFGRVSSYEKAGTEYVKIVNPNPISEICKFLNGKIIPVKKLVAQRDKLLKADSIEAVKKIAPWYSDKKALGLKEVPKDIALPPYHAHCKSDTVIAYAEEIEAVNEK